MATMKDVAKRAGVSLGTVSNVLNNRASVKQENRDRVLQAVEELDFRANMVARALKTKTSKDIALVIPNINNPFYPEVARGVGDVANKAGYQVFLCNNDRICSKEYSYIESLLTKNISGVVLVKSQVSEEHIRELSRQIAVVMVDAQLPPQAGVHVLNVDDNNGFGQGMQLLYDHGHTRIAFISGMMESISSHKRWHSYKEFLKSHGIPFREDYVIKGDYTWSSGYKAAQIFMQLRQPPTAIFAANDLMAIGSMKALGEIGKKVPDDISVIGYDNIDMAKLCTPTLTTVNQPKYDLGARSAKLLLQMLENGGAQQAGSVTLLSTHVVLRESVAAVKERD